MVSGGYPMLGTEDEATPPPHIPHTDHIEPALNGCLGTKAGAEGSTRPGQSRESGARLEDPRADGVHEVLEPPQGGKEWDSGIKPSLGPEASLGEPDG